MGMQRKKSGPPRLGPIKGFIECKACGESKPVSEYRTRENGRLAVRKCFACRGFGVRGKKVPDPLKPLTCKCGATFLPWLRSGARKTYAHKCKPCDTLRAKRGRDPSRVMLTAAAARSREAGAPFDLDMSDVAIPDVCPLLGIPLARSTTGKPCDGSPSLDRLVPGKGYTKGNVWVISWRANAIKRDATPDELERIARNLRARLR